MRETIPLLMQQAETLRNQLDREAPPPPTAPLSWEAVSSTDATTAAATAALVMQYTTPVLAPTVGALGGVATAAASYLLPMTVAAFLNFLRLLPYINSLFSAAMLLSASVEAYRRVNALPDSEPEAETERNDPPPDEPVLAEPATGEEEERRLLEPEPGIDVANTRVLSAIEDRVKEKVRRFKAALKAAKRRLLSCATFPETQSGGGAEPTASFAGRGLGGLKRKLALEFADKMLDDAINEMPVSDSTTFQNVADYMRDFVYIDRDFVTAENNQIQDLQSVRAHVEAIETALREPADRPSSPGPLGPTGVVEAYGEAQHVPGSIPPIPSPPPPPVSAAAGGGAGSPWMPPVIGALAALTAAAAFVPH